MGGWIWFALGALINVVEQARARRPGATSIIGHIAAAAWGAVIYGTALWLIVSAVAAFAGW